MSNAAILPKLLGVLRSLSALPDSPVGLVAWSHLEKLCEKVRACPHATASARGRPVVFALPSHSSPPPVS